MYVTLLSGIPEPPVLLDTSVLGGFCVVGLNRMKSHGRSVLRNKTDEEAL